MAEQNETDFPADNDGVVSKGAQPVCSKCFQPGPPQQYYCTNCDSNEPLNPLASYMPFVRIRFGAGVAGKLWRKALSKETSVAMRAFSLLLIGIGMPIILAVGLPLLLISKIKNDSLRRIATVAFFAVLVMAIAAYVGLI